MKQPLEFHDEDGIVVRCEQMQSWDGLEWIAFLVSADDEQSQNFVGSGETPEQALANLAIAWYLDPLDRRTR